MKLAAGFPQIPLYRLRNFPSFPVLLRTFIMNGVAFVKCIFFWALKYFITTEGSWKHYVLTDNMTHNSGWGAEESVVSVAEATSLDQEPFDGPLDGLDLLLPLWALFDGDGAGDDRPGDPAGSPQSLLGAHEHIGHVLVLTQQREVRMIPKGSASAAIVMNSEMPLLSVLVASLAPFRRL